MKSQVNKQFGELDGSVVIGLQKLRVPPSNFLGY